jgi:4-hydroxybenzoyl-CoA reductase subunit alpha
VLKTYVGGGFGGKMEPTGLRIRRCCARPHYRQAREDVYDRAEMFAHNRVAIARSWSSPRAWTGTVRSWASANFIMDGGAYTSLGIASAYYAGALLTLTYDFEHYKFDMYRVYTNLPACGAQRGHGAPQPKYAFECHLDNIARELRIDPIEIRLLNARKPNTTTPNDFRINSCELEACLKKARDISGWDQKKGRLPKGRGMGVAVGGFVSGAGYPVYRTNLRAAAIIKVHEDGCRNLLHRCYGYRRGSDTCCQIAAEAIGFKYENARSSPLTLRRRRMTSARTRAAKH